MRCILLGLLFVGSSLHANEQDVMTHLESLGKRNVALQNAIYAHEEPFMKALDCKHIVMYEGLAQKTALISNIIELIEYAVMVQREFKGPKTSWLESRSSSNLQYLPATVHRMKAQPDPNRPTYDDEVDLQKIVADLEITLALINNH